MTRADRPSVFIDLDGTLTDPKTGIVRSIQHALRRMGRREIPDDDALVWCIGPPLRQSFSILLGTADDAAVEAAVAFYRERFADVGLFENAVYPGIPAMLDALTAAGYRLMVATSKPTIYARRIVERFDLGRHFERVFGSELDGTRADKGDLLRHAVAESAADPARSAMIGDRVHDAMGARAANMKCLLVAWGYATEDELATAGSDGVCSTPAGIPPAVARLLG